MVGIDIGRNLEDKTSELLFLGLYLTLLSLCRTGAGRNFHEAVQQFLHTKIIKRRTKEYRSYLC